MNTPKVTAMTALFVVPAMPPASPIACAA